jgi:predicted amidohydrolase YtcJ
MCCVKRSFNVACAPLALAAVLGTGHAACSAPGSHAAVADVIFRGQFITLDPSHPRVDALAVANGRIVSAGSFADIERVAAQTTRRVDVPGVGVPGFADAHAHLSSLGQQVEQLDLRTLTKEQILEKVGEAARTAAPGAWISGNGWDQGFFRPAVFPSASDLDAVSGDHPVALTRIDGHSSWINSKALMLAGISANTKDPPGGRIIRDERNQPTGILVDRAQEAISQVRPARSAGADRERQIRAALQQYARWGLTSVHDAGTDLDTIAVYKQLLKSGELPVRLYVMARGAAAIEHYLANGPERDLGDHLLAIRSIKLISDGALGSRGAELTDPYADAPEERGLQQTSDADLDKVIREGREKGVQINVHAIGDRAVRRVLDAFERGGVKTSERFRVEHASMISPADLPRFARLGVIASVQPVFIGEYSRWAHDRVGPNRIQWVLPIRELVTSGAPVAFGTDFTASDSGDPLATLASAVAGQSASGSAGAQWFQRQRIDLDTALRAMTGGPAFAAFEETNLGQLTAGRYADITVLSADPYTVQPDALGALSVRMTIVGGRVTYDGSNGSPASPAQRFRQ